MKRTFILLLNYLAVFSLLLMINGCASHSRNKIDLAGKWFLALDEQDIGVNEKWYQKQLSDNQITLPGSLQMQGYGENPSLDSNWTIGNITGLLKDERYTEYTQAKDFKCPYWLTPQKVYVGPAWYQKSIKIPDSWQNKRIVLFLERPHCQTKVWIDDKKIGARNTLGTGHQYDLTDVVTAGENKLTIRVDNQIHIPFKKDAHSVTDQTQTNWNGIIGKIELKATNKVWIDDVQIYPDVKNKKIKVKTKIGSLTNKPGDALLTVQAKNNSFVGPKPKTIPIQWKKPNEIIEFEYFMDDDVLLWDEFSPNLYTLELNLNGKNINETKKITFGMREIAISGTQFTLNGRNLFLRGTLECAAFPKTGYPPTDVQSWKDIIAVCKEYGLNHIRFHSWCPPKAAFIAADEMGFFYQVEASTWATFGDGTAVDKWVYKEADQILKEYGNHPSFILMSAGNESHGKNREAFLSKLVNYWKSKGDNRRFYTGTTGWPMIPENDYHAAQGPRLQLYEGLRLIDKPNTRIDYTKFIEETDKPILSHEVGQWCSYPNIEEIKKYDGLTRATTIEIPLDFLKRAGIEHLAKDFLMSSGNFQTLLYKQEIEAALRTPDMAGFQLLGLYDYPGWGLATVGVLDAFWESKGYISGAQYRRFCSETVPLARLEKFVFTNNETLKADIDLANYGPSDIKVNPSWYLKDKNKNIFQSGKLVKTIVKTGGLTSLGDISIDLNRFTKAQKLNLEIVIDDQTANDWDIWVYPANIQTDESKIYICDSITEKTISALQAGQNVLMMPQTYRINADTLGTFKPIFWNRVTFVSQVEHHLGILCDPKHRALADFPTDYYCNWQWWELMQHCKPVIMDDLPGKIEPIVRVIDDWALARNLGLIFEVSVGNGKLLFCSIDLNKDLKDRPVAKQLRYSLINYMKSDKFTPDKSVTIEELNQLFKEPSLLQTLDAKVAYVDCYFPSNEAFQAIDNDPDTCWVTTWMPKIEPYPHEIQIEINKAIEAKGFTYLSRQDGDKKGFINEYEFYVSNDNKNWSAPAAKGRFARDKSLKEVLFDKPQTGKYFRLVGLSGFEDDPFAAVAELGLIVED